MSNSLVVYQSAYGHTKVYAEWIAQELGCPAITAAEATLSRMYEPEVIVFGGGVYAGKIEGMAPLIKHYQALAGKKLVVFTVGLTMEEPDYYKQLAVKNFPAEIREHLHFYHFRGGVNYDALRLSHRAIMAMMVHLIRRKPQLTEDDRVVISAYGKNADLSDRTAIFPLIEYALTRR